MLRPSKTTRDEAAGALPVDPIRVPSRNGTNTDDVRPPRKTAFSPVRELSTIDLSFENGPAYTTWRDLPRLTYFSGAVILVLGIVNLILTLFEFDRHGLLWLFFYSIPANTAISIFPHEPVIVYCGQYFSAMLVTLVALAGNLAAGFVDYHFFEPVLRMKSTAGYRKTKTYGRAMRWFSTAPFWSVVLFALTPLPFYIVKFLSFSSGYPMRRYMVALALGRLPRFYLLAVAGGAFHVPVSIMVAIFSAIFAAYILFIARGLLRSRAVRQDSGTPEDVSTCPD